jgi:alkylation response protein AidB-like acyl-CoA dehydrogenase
VRDSPALHEQLGRLLADSEAIRLMGARSVAARAAGEHSDVPGILKLFGSESVQRAASFAFEASAGSGDAATAAFDEYLESLAATIYGGTSEIQRNIIAERILGAPK